MQMRNMTVPALLLCAAALLSGGCGGSQNAPAQPARLPEVNTLVVAPYAVTYKTELAGRTSAFFVSEVRPQVNGIIRDRLFDEGALVEKGQQLYQIDPATYRAGLNSANAALQRAQAAYNAARLLAERYARVVAVNGVSRQQYDDAVAARNQAEAEVLAARAAVETAEINLEYTKVLAPISGYIGRSSVTPGALVTANQAQPLATVQYLDTMYVDVTQSSADILRLKKALADGSIKPAEGGGAGVELLLEDGSRYAYLHVPDGDGKPVASRGELQFSDVSVDPGTGMVTIRAVFPNPDGLLFPGMYVKAILQEGVIERAVIVPQQAVSRDASGRPTTLAVVRNPKAGTVDERTGRPEPDSIVEYRILTVDRVIDDQYWLVTSGLAFGDQVIMEGSLKVRPGGGVIGRPMESPIRESDTIKAVQQ
jgi:membrane fusion protein (multidrug efflux system)